jgi:ribosomal protein S18 acetylase RimI-like enzyme
MTEYVVRRAGPRDLGKLVEFALSEAAEAEGIRKRPETVRRGIRAALEDESVATYWVVHARPGEIAGNISVVREWSNWNAGYYWWVQSLYVKPEHRRRGFMKRLLAAVRESARQSRALDLRLYVHKNNKRAIKAYRKAGFIEADYRIMRTPLGRESRPDRLRRREK